MTYRTLEEDSALRKLRCGYEPPRDLGVAEIVTAHASQLAKQVTDHCELNEGGHMF